MRRSTILFITAALAGCGQSRSSERANLNDASTATAATTPAGFQPLQSDAVKNAMHRALTSGETQRWEDADLSGYAVPGPPGKNGCRAIRYTVDQRPAGNFESITACEAGVSGAR